MIRGVILRPKFWYVVLAVLAVASLSLVLYSFDPTQNSFYPVCFFHRATGLLCPGCGSLRAMHQLLHGHVFTALRDNLIMMLTLVIAGVFGLRHGWLKLQSKPATLNVQPVWIWTGVITFFIFGIVRNLPAQPFALLRP